MTIIEIIKEVFRPIIIIPFLTVSLIIIYNGQSIGFIIGVGYSSFLMQHLLIKMNKED